MPVKLVNFELQSDQTLVHGIGRTNRTKKDALHRMIINTYTIYVKKLVLNKVLTKNEDKNGLLPLCDQVKIQGI